MMVKEEPTSGQGIEKHFGWEEWLVLSTLYTLKCMLKGKSTSFYI